MGAASRDDGAELDLPRRVGDDCADVAGADALNAAGIAFNLSAATLGNIVGGAVLVALGYWFIYAKKSEA